MTNSIKTFASKITITLLLMFFSLVTFAQGLDVDIDLNKNDEWYKNPMYLIGIGIFIILLVLVSRVKKK